MEARDEIIETVTYSVTGGDNGPVYFQREENAIAYAKELFDLHPDTVTFVTLIRETLMSKVIFEKGGNDEH